MDLVNKISLAEKNNKDSVLNNVNLSDEENVILYKEFFKKHLFVLFVLKTFKMSSCRSGGTEN